MAQILERGKRNGSANPRSFHASRRRRRRAPRRIKENISELNEAALTVSLQAQTLHAATDKMMGNYQVRGNEAVLLESGNRAYEWRDAYLMLELIESTVPKLEQKMSEFMSLYFGS